MLTGPFTTLVWLHSPVAAPQLPRERVLADAYAALNPADRLWRKFNDEIDRLKEAGKLDDEEIQFLRLADESRIALMDYTRGEVDAYTEGTALQVLERARAAAQADVRGQLSAEQEAHANSLKSIAGTENRVRAIASTLGNATATLVFLVVTLALVGGMVLGPVGPLDLHVVPSWVQVLSLVLGIFALALNAMNLIAGGSLLQARRRVAATCAAYIEKLLRRTLQL